MVKAIEISDRIKALRGQLGKTQAEFAQLIGVTQPAISDWESATGSTGPSSESYAQLAGLASYPDSLWFLEQAGVDTNAALSTFGKLQKERGEMALTLCTLVPPFRKKGEASPKPEDFLPWPTKYIPDPNSVAYWQIDHHVGHTTMPQLVPLGDKAIILLDTSANDAVGFQPFRGKAILVESTGEAAAAHEPGAIPAGVHMGRLRMKAWAGTSLDYMSYLAVLVPLQGEVRWTSPPGPSIGAGSSTTKWRLRNPDVEPHHPRASVLAEDQAAEDGRLFPGCTILGRVLAWFRPPSKTGK